MENVSFQIISMSFWRVPNIELPWSWCIDIDFGYQVWSVSFEEILQNDKRSNPCCLWNTTASGAMFESFDPRRITEKIEMDRARFRLERTEPNDLVWAHRASHWSHSHLALSISELRSVVGGPGLLHRSKRRFWTAGHSVLLWR